MDDSNGLVSRLIQKQTERAMKDAEFAALIGCRRVHWNHIKHGRRIIGPRVARAIVAAFPDLKRAVARYQATLDTTRPTEGDGRGRAA